MTKPSPLSFFAPDRRDRLVAALDYVAVAVTLGLVTGTVSVLFWLYGVYLDNFVGWNSHKLWMPLASESLFVLMLLGLAAPLARLLPRRSFDFVAAGFAVFAAAFAVLVTPGLLHPWAVGLLSMGLGIQSARFFQNHSTSLRRVCRFLAPAGALFALLIAGSVSGSRAWHEKATIAELPPAPAEAPNVVLVVWDTVRTDFVGTFDPAGAPTPNLDRLAKRGVAFDRAISTAPWTLPSHTSMFTGKFPNEFSASWFTPIDPDQTMLAEVLQGHGYQTGGFVANTVYCGRGVGMDQGFAHYNDEHFLANPSQFYNCNSFFHLFLRKVSPANRFPPGPVITNRFLDWHETTRADRPFFAFLNYMDAHTPYLPEKIDGRPMTEREIAKMRVFERMDPEKISEADRELAQKCYRAQITALDAELGRMIKTLRRRKALKNTVVIVVSDHGEHFGEHGLYLHGNSLYQPLVHVPLVIRRPEETRAGKRVANSVSLRNIAATILECAGIKEETGIRGRSLLDDAKAAETAPEQSPSSEDPVYAYNKMEALKHNTRHSPLAVLEKSLGWQGRLDLWVDEDFFLIRGPDDDAELYNVARDPREMHDLSRQSPSRSLFRRMQRELDEFLEDSSVVKSPAEK